MGKLVNEFPVQPNKVKELGKSGILVNWSYPQSKTNNAGGNVDGRFFKGLDEQDKLKSVGGKAGKMLIWLILQFKYVKEVGNVGKAVKTLPSHISVSKEFGKVGKLESAFSLHIRVRNELGKSGRIGSPIPSLINEQSK